MQLASATQTKQYSYRPEIDGIRALAVLAVIINHFNKDLLPSGYLGVDIFFVISGFVITSSLAGRPSKNFRDFLMGFYTRRIKRLAPALLLFALITGVSICLFDPNPDASLKTGIASLFGISNIYLLKISTDYFSASTELNVFIHTWSLGVEEQFYFLFPLLVWVTGFGRLTSKGSRNLAWVMGALAFVSLVSFMYAYQVNQPAAYFLMPTRLWELGAGCLLFLGLSHPNKFLRGLKNIPPLMVCVVIVAVLFAPLQYAVEATIAVVVLTVTLIICLRSGTAAYAIFSYQPVVYIGLISYSLYLWHWGILSLSRWTLGIHWWSVPFQIALLLLLSSASYRYIETPIRHSDWTFLRWQSIRVGVGSYASIVVLLVVLRYTLYGKLFTGNMDVEDTSSSLILSSHLHIEEATRKMVYDCNMTPQLLTDESYRPQPLIDKSFIQNCLKSSTPGKNKLVLIGDSFAQVSAGHLAVIAADINYDFRIIFGYDCPYPLRYSEIKSHAREKCSMVDDELLISELISSLNKGDILVLRLYLPKNQYLLYGGAGKLPPADAYDQALRSLIDSVKSKDAKLIVVGANPTLSQNLVNALRPQWFKLASSVESILPSENNETAYFHSNDLHLREFFDNLEGASFFSLETYICNSSGECPIHDGDKMLYTDNQHLSLYAHSLFFDELDRHIKGLAELTSKESP